MVVFWIQFSLDEFCIILFISDKNRECLTSLPPKTLLTTNYVSDDQSIELEHYNKSKNDAIISKIINSDSDIVISEVTLSKTVSSLSGDDISSDDDSKEI